jgi:hypothetical protein
MNHLRKGTLKYLYVITKFNRGPLHETKENGGESKME